MTTSNRQHKQPWRSRWAICCWAMALLFVVFALSFSALTVEAQTNKAAKAAPKQSADAARSGASSRRVEELEEQVVDLQVVIGTLESLAKTDTNRSRGTFSDGRSLGAGKGVDAQVRVLSAEVKRLSAEVSALQSGGWTPPTTRQLTEPAFPSAPDTTINSGFGATTVRPSDQPDAIGTLIEEAPQFPAEMAANSPQVEVQQLPPASGDDGSARAVYQSAYTLVLQQEYASAQAGFREFLRKYPEHALVPNALYWLGETYYVQENYTDAAEAFDIVTAAYGSSNKAPDSQLKRGMSLANLGKRSEACSVLRALAKRYPNAPTHVKSKAEDERQRAGCS